jgi:CDP-4-dehydro-6-deoxyglucose reductase
VLGLLEERALRAVTLALEAARPSILFRTMAPSQPFDVRLAASRRLAPAVRELVFERVDGAPFAFDPGQWVNLVLPLPSGEIKRAYSIATAPGAGSPRFALAVTKVADGPGSQYLHALEEGATLRAIGPQGLFTRSPSEEGPSLFVGTGTGVTPLRSMIEAALLAGARAPLWLLFGARFEEDILYREEFERWAGEYPHFRYEITLSQGGPSWGGRRGYVQRHVPELVGALRKAAAPAEVHGYVCGLERMVNAVRDLMRGELGVPRRHVHAERYD